jgi:hypothetical protein
MLSTRIFSNLFLNLPRIVAGGPMRLAAIPAGFESAEITPKNSAAALPDFVTET